jgi:hypothetical protein
VLYRSAKFNPTRRFHALYGHVARSDILWRAWVDVATNRGAPGIDGQSFVAVENGVGGVRAFLDDIAAALRGRKYRPAPLRRVPCPPGLHRENNASRTADSWDSFEAELARAVPFSPISPSTRNWAQSPRPSE